ncbi:MAG: hypothetical protein KAG53_08535, partial [Endozoicomonadaceae bacterium]|nr:hypothetical protein [Endozoicomonadaceae bacterium]
PPLQEQQAIANYLDSATGKIDTLIEKQQKLIELLKEKRTALISAAVTGKIKVTDDITKPLAADATTGVTKIIKKTVKKNHKKITQCA